MRTNKMKLLFCFFIIVRRSMTEKGMCDNLPHLGASCHRASGKLLQSKGQVVTVPILFITVEPRYNANFGNR